ncbi:hypothetical protein [Vibrio parahaemolyticus]|uniref:hypothetical protein n=1 Tax=Vibrio parahaemolyticus TaxID=670 RepID=UPI002269CDE2|nr:hypothetical protein [Vibrio parahaemolyticus]MCX8796034.1 hypothetical protein [Vibrio parahaemolyticus]
MTINTINLSISQIETIVMESYQAGAKHIGQHFDIDSKALNQAIKNDLNDSVEFISKSSLKRYSQSSKITIDDAITLLNNSKDAISKANQEIRNHFEPIIKELLDQNKVKEAQEILATMPECTCRMQLAGVIAMK